MEDTNVTGTPAGNEPAGADGGTPNSSATGPKPAGQGEPGAAATDKGFTYKEDRSDWAPRHRLKEVEDRTAARVSKELESRYKVEIEARDKKLRILAGVEDVDPKSAEDAKIKAEIERMFPSLGKMTPEKLERLDALLSQADGIESATMQVHERHAEEMIGGVEREIEESLGSELTDKQRTSIRRAYRDEAAAALNGRDRDPNHDTASDFLSRHDRGDKTLIKEFADSFLKDWFDVARRKVTNDAVSRYRPVPRAQGGRPMTSQPAKIDFSKPGAFEDALAQARAEEGRGYRE